MTQIQIVQDIFGQRYRLCTDPHDRPNTKIEAKKFLSQDSAERFISRLHVENTFWRKLLNRDSPEMLFSQSKEALMAVLAQRLVKGKIRVYKLGSVNTAERAKPAQSKTRNGEDLRVMSAEAALLEPNKNIVKISNLEEAKRELSPLDTTQISGLANTLAVQHNVGAQSDEEKFTQVAQALMDGRLVMHKTQAQLRSPKLQEIENTRSAPGHRPIDAPPSQQPAPQSEAKPARRYDEDQAATLVAAAEAGDALCEDCEKEEDSEPYKILLPAGF